MRTVYALFVGIDDYPDHSLKGCVNDIEAAKAWLARQPGLRTVVQSLPNDKATRAAVLQGIRSHLGRCGPGDTALFWFSGHGASRPTKDPREATGHYQALVCHDSLGKDGRALIQDTRLGPMLDRIARDGAHVVAVLDCCHSGGATRDGEPGVGVRGVDWQPQWDAHPDAEAEPVPAGARDAGGTGPEPRRHALFAACRPQEKACEGEIDGEHRGYFSHAVLEALNRLGPATTYGRVHALVEERVRTRSGASYPQHPELRGAENRRFLHGDELDSAPFLLRHTEAGWEVNCGLTHGLSAVGAEFTVLAGGGPARAGRRVVVRTLRPESALVQPVGWQPTRDEKGAAFAVTPSALAFPPAAVTVSGEPGAVRLVERAVAAAPLLGRGGHGLPLHVEVRDGAAAVSGGGGIAPTLPLRTAADATRVADCLSHITRWHQIRDLANPDPWVSSLIRVTFDEPVVGRLRRTATGEVVCSYTGDHRPPQVRVRIHNDSSDELWCVVVALSEVYSADTDLYPGDFIAGRYRAVARRDQPVCFWLPAGQDVTPGAFTRDWLKVIVAERELNTVPFLLPDWSLTAPPSAGRGTAAPDDGLLHLAPPTGGRVAGGGPDVGRWGTASVLVRTEVP